MPLPSALLEPPRTDARRGRAAYFATGAIVLAAALALFAVQRSRHATQARGAETRELIARMRKDLESKDPLLGRGLEAADIARLGEAESWIYENLTREPALAAELLLLLAHVQRESGDAAQGLELARKASAFAVPRAGDTPTEWLAVLDAEGLALLDLGRHPEAEKIFAREREGWTRRGEGTSEGALLALHNLALAIQRQGRYEEALGLLRECLSGRTALLGSQHASTLATKAALARLLLDSGTDLAEAVALLREVREDETRRLGANSPRTHVTGSVLGAALTVLGEHAEARTLLVPAMAELERALGPEHLDTLGAKKNLAVLEAASGDRKSARDHFADLLAVARARFGPEDVRTVEMVQRLATAETELGNPSAAASLWEEALAAMGDASEAPPEVRASALYQAHLCLKAVGKDAEAKTRVGELLEWVRAKLPEDHPMRGAAEEAAASAGIEPSGEVR